MIISLTVGVLVGGAVYLILQRGMVRIVFGLGLLSHAVNLLLLVTGVSAWRAEPLTDGTGIAPLADPLPQAFVLTAIVISLAVTVFMLFLAVIGHDDDTHVVPDTGQGRPR